MADKQKKELTPEEQQRKDRVRLRLFMLLICLDVLLAGYLIFEMIVIITNSMPKNNASIDLLSIIQNIRNCL